MASITLDTPVAEALNKSIHGRIVSEGWTQDDDTALAEYIVLMLANGKTQDQIASELASDLLPDAQGTEEFSQWLFEQVTQLTGGGSSVQPQGAASDAPAQSESTESAIPAAYETDMTEAPPDNAPKGPRNSSMSRGGRGGRGGLPSKPADSALHRTRGNDRINSHSMRGTPKGPRGSLQNRPGMQKALNGLVSPTAQGMGPNGLPNQGGNMQFSPEQQMQYLHMMEQQAQLMAQWNQLQQGVNFQGGGPQGRGYVDRGRGGRGRGRGAFQNQNGSRNGSAAASEPKEGEPASADAPMEGAEQPPASKSYDPATTMCHFNSRCTNKTCPYAHQSPAAPMNIPVDTSQVCQFGVACKNQSCTARHPSPALKQAHQSQSECKYWPNCTKPNCPFSHPSAPLCSFGASCTTENCKFTHLSTMCRFNPCTNALCKFKHAEGQNRSMSDYTWTPESAKLKEEQKQQELEKKHVSDRKFVSDDAGDEELIKPEGGEEAAAPVSAPADEANGTVT